MKAVIAGSRSITDESEVFAILDKIHSNVGITLVISGTADGVDKIGESWGKSKRIKVDRYPADWKNIHVPGAVIKYNKFGPYNVKAGSDRNLVMGKKSDIVIVIWDGKSTGSKDMFETAKSLRKDWVLYNKSNKSLIHSKGLCKTTVVNKEFSLYDIYIGRGSKWGNPYRITGSCNRVEAIKKYEQYVRNKKSLMRSLIELRGKRLGCHCYPKQCHGEVLIKLLEKTHGYIGYTEDIRINKKKQRTFGFLRTS